MKRLTTRDEYGNADIIGVDSEALQLNLKYRELYLVTIALNRLAAYEDKGLMPNEVAKVMLAVDRASELQAENAKLRKVAVLCQDWDEFDYYVGIPIQDDAADNQARRAYYDFIDRMRQALAELDKEGER